MPSKHIHILNELFFLWQQANWNYFLLGNNPASSLFIMDRVRDFFLIHHFENYPPFDETREHSRLIQLLLCRNDSTLLQICRHPTSLPRILSRHALFYGIFCEEIVLFSPDLFLQFSDADHPLVAFSNNPNFHWEILADSSWKYFDFNLLSLNSTTHNPHFRNALLLRELDSLGILLDWNSFDAFHNDLFSSSSSSSKKFKFSL